MESIKHINQTRLGFDIIDYDIIKQGFKVLPGVVNFSLFYII